MEPGQSMSIGGKIGVAVVIVLVLAAGIWGLQGKYLPKGKGGKDVNLAGYQKQVSAIPDGATSVKEYDYLKDTKLPAVKGVSQYKWNDADPTVVFPINQWIGWLPIVAANNGFSPNTESIFYKKYGFKVLIKLIDDPVTARDVYTSGESHVLWGTLDMIGLFAPGLMQDSRTAPRVVQQIDWSSGGDGIIVRDYIKSVNDLVGKTVVYAENSPSQYYINTLLLSSNIQPNRLAHKPTKTAFEASAAFVSEETIDACVSWAPDIYTIPDKVKGTKLLSSTADASKVIADVYAVRADFMKDHPKIVYGLVDGIFEAMQKIDKDPAYKQKACVLLAKGYGFPVSEIEKMLPDAHSTNFSENKNFFLNSSNAANFERTWDRIQFVYSELGKIDNKVAFSAVMDPSIIKQINAEGRYASQSDNYSAQFSQSDWSRACRTPLLTSAIHVQFYPNDDNPFFSVPDETTPGKARLYDPDVNKTLAKAAQLIGQFDKAVVRIVGHTDDSKRGVADPDDVRALSQKRADSIAKVLVTRYKFPAEKIRSLGVGWDEPANPNDPNNHSLNRRVEIQIITLEAVPADPSPAAKPQQPKQ